jgi:hypothetical protein
LLGSAARTAGRTAVIAGTATAVAGSVAQKQQAKAVAAQASPDTPPAPPAPAAAGVSDDTLAKLKALGELKDSGVLTEEEFSVEKAKLLGG